MDNLGMFQPTKLPPLEEALFKGWGKANQVEDVNAPGNSFDYRGMYIMSGGKVQAPGMVNDMATEHNNQLEQQKAAQDVAKKQESEAKKQATDAMKKQESAQKLNFDIEKTRMTLQQLLMKRELGL